MQQVILGKHESGGQMRGFSCKDDGSRKRNRTGAFTLVELSVMLVIIGLIVGGVLVGQDLIHAAKVRAQISQIEQYNAAARTFQTKYNSLPGDIKDPEATGFGLAARGLLPGQGDGNGIIEGFWSNSGACGICSAAGETVMFWVDLSQTHLIAESFTTARSDTSSSSYGSTPVNLLLPEAKIGDGNFVYVYSSCAYSYQNSVIGCWGSAGQFFGISKFGYIQPDNGFRSAAGTSVKTAYLIDRKIDDGFPQSGNVIAKGISAVIQWSSGAVIIPGVVNYSGPAPGNAAAASSTSCYDNNGNAGVASTYSVQVSGGYGINCDLAIAFH